MSWYGDMIGIWKIKEGGKCAEQYFIRSELISHGSLNTNITSTSIAEVSRAQNGGYGVFFRSFS